MIQPRLIVCLLLKHGVIVRSQLFSVHQVIGNPISTVQRLSNWNIDELVLLDISEDDYHDLRRDDLAITYSGTSTLDVLRQISDVCCMPLAAGGRIRNTNDIRKRLTAGADKVIINTAAIKTPKLISDGAKAFGSQCIVASIDVLRHGNGRLEVYSEGGKTPCNIEPTVWAKEVEERGAGEIFLNSIDRDGSGWGYDIDLIKSVVNAVDIPVIACGGVGKYEDFPKAIVEGGASAAAAANIFHFFELSYPLAKKACLDAGLKMRKVGLNSRWFPREYQYDFEHETGRLQERLDRAHKQLEPKSLVGFRRNVHWCRECCYPTISATPMELDKHGVCMGCRAAEAKKNIPRKIWDQRTQILIEILEENKSTDGSRPDCIIPVGGGKDSYFQVHYIKNVLGYNPLMVTYHSNNYSPEGEYNLYRMREVFDCDHVIVYPNVSLLKKLNRLGFIIMGDMNWHNHIGMPTVCLQVAAARNIPILIWGEHGYTDLSGQFSMNDFVEFTYRHKIEHFGRGFEWSYFVGREGITSQDMYLYKQPDDETMFNIGLRGLFLGNYIYWEANEHTQLMIDLYDWKPSEESFDRTYRTMSNVDDIHENGAHDYMKWIKFGYGRCTDHVSKDIRAGKLNRNQGIELVRQYDHIKPKDIQERWLDYAGFSMEEFDAIADTFRDPRVWYKGKTGEWLKDDI